MTTRDSEVDKMREGAQPQGGLGEEQIERIIADISNHCPVCNGAKEIVRRPARLIGYTGNPQDIEEGSEPCPCCTPIVEALKPSVKDTEGGAG